MHRFYLPGLTSESRSLQLHGSEATHASQVLRVRKDEAVAVLNGRGLTALAVVRTVSRREVQLTVSAVQNAAPRPFELTLFQSITKPKSMEWVVQKSTELGAHTFQPVITERVVSQSTADTAARKVEKWERIAVEALKQCGQPWLPRIQAPAHLEALVATAPCSFVASLQPEARPLRGWLGPTTDCVRTNTPARIGLWIGPEGDFTEDETHMLMKAGAHPITLGNSVLRSETAAVCGLALLEYELSHLFTHGIGLSQESAPAGHGPESDTPSEG